jgi:hypothetical protein
VALAEGYQVVEAIAADGPNQLGSDRVVPTRRAHNQQPAGSASWLGHVATESRAPAATASPAPSASGLKPARTWSEADPRRCRRRDQCLPPLP